tara:strand:+ start:99 stop:911 length:813 start_codon:yes stop_codon:yes gene_type:complete
MSHKMKIFCVTDVESKILEELNLILVGVGKRKFSKNYINIKNRDNIQSKEKNYSELTFHYWFWKNKLNNFDQNTWIGFSQKRRFWLKKNLKVNKLKDLKKNLLKEVPSAWKNYQSVICKPISVKNPKKIKLIKRGWKNLIDDPTIFFKKNKQSIKLHFDMHHGYGVIDKAIDMMNLDDREEFRKYINKKNKFNPNIMYISKKKILQKWFKDLFNWLFDCEKIFGIEKLSGYDQQRLYAYLAERYASFWFKKYSKFIAWHWTFFDTKNENL